VGPHSYSARSCATAILTPVQLPAIAAQQSRNFSDVILYRSEDAEAVYNSASRVSRILLVTPQPFYEDRGTPIAVQYVARALGQLGFNVDILTLPVGEDVSLPRTRIRRCANPFHIRSVPIGFSWRKVVMDLSLWRSFDRLLATRQYDLVHAVEDAAYIASILCPRYQQPFIYDMASAIPLELQRKALFRGAMARRFITAAERRVFKRASHVVCSAGLAEYVNLHYP
jgi:hypothetical protein